MSYFTDKFDDKIVEILKQGGVGILPSDTVYGLSGPALDKKAVRRIHELKGRDADKPFIVLISNTKMLNMLSISVDCAEAVMNYWPGPLSIILPSAAPDFLARGTKTLAVRLPDYPALRDLIDKVGPIISTSANLQGQKPLSSAAEAKKLFGDKLDFYVDAGTLNNPPSTLAALKNGRLHVIRQGAVKIKP